MIFDTRCLACHSIGAGPKVGPDLLGVTERRNEKWITSWLHSPETMLAHDDTAKALLERFKLPMPNQNLTDADIGRLLKYFRWAGKNPPPAGTDTTSARPTP